MRIQRFQTNLGTKKKLRAETKSEYITLNIQTTRQRQRKYQTVRKLRKIVGRNEAPSAPGLRKFLRKGRETGMLMDNRSHPIARPVRTAERIAAVVQSVRENPKTSTRHRTQQLNVSRISLRKILHKDLGLFAYKVQLTEEPAGIPQLSLAWCG
ncbi:hypothetical protein NQ318_017109 [Aromia moschata]|uniref:Uncharacterized protein n=1 Tax=Aromia moschata TaxID=1265417 RepID=A0AAV8Y3K9_9CUCU|nr:hypothetical protein NQ318_017109 [Aromia moschata]